MNGTAQSSIARQQEFVSCRRVLFAILVTGLVSSLLSCDSPDSPVESPPPPTQFEHHLVLDAEPSWSADDSTIVYYHVGITEILSSESFIVNPDSQGLWIVQTVGDKAHLVLRAEESRAKFSPIDNSVVVQANLQIYRTSLVDGFLTSPTQLTSVGNNFDPVWSRDNSLIAFESNASGRYAIWRMQATGEDKRKIPLKWSTRVNDVDWFPSGDQIVGSAYDVDSQSWDLVVFDTAGTVVGHLAQSRENETRPHVSPDGNTVAFERSGWVWLVDADNSGARRLVRGINPAWSHSGKWIAYIAADWSARNGVATVWKIDVASGEVSILTRGP